MITKRVVEKVITDSKNPDLPSGRALKTVPETGVKSDLAFCLGSLNEKTNSDNSMGLKNANTYSIRPPKYTYSYSNSIR